MMELCGTRGNQRGAPDLGRSMMSALVCPLITALVVCLLMFEFASALAGGSSIGGLVLLGLAAFCIYRCHKKKSCNPC